MKKLADIGFLLSLILVLLVIPIRTLTHSAKNTVSYYENRTLAAVPACTEESFWSGDYFSDWETWYSDHVPGRTTLLTQSTAIQMNVLKRPVVNGVIADADVLLPFQGYKTWDTTAYQKKAAPVADGFAALTKDIQDYGGQFWFVGMPEQSNYFWDKYPAEMDSRRWNASVADATFYQALGERGVNWLDMGAVYDAQGRLADYYSSVDHHFTYYGAFAAYQAILGRVNTDSGLNLPVLGKDDLDFQTLPNPYLGSRSRKLYNLWPNDEHAVLGILKNPIPFTRTDNGTQVASSVYVIPENNTRLTTYDLYMGGDKAETIIRTNRPDLPDALIFGDSFTNALETMLYTSFDETRSLDLRHYTEKSLREYLETYHPEVVICVCNDTFFYTDTGNINVWDH